jgi:HD-like signal output (HDOD) protein
MLAIVRHMRFASQALADACVSDDAFMAGLLLAFGLVAIVASFRILMHPGG